MTSWRARLASPNDPFADAMGPTPWRGWGLVAYLCALLLALGIGYFLIRVPLQVSDNIWNLITVDRLSYSTLLTQFGVQRPLLWVTLKAVADASQGHYFATFRGLHVAQLVLLFVLVVRLLGVRGARDAAVVPLCLVALAGFHTFRNLVQEAYPINTYLSMLVYLAAALNVTIARPGRLPDVIALVLLMAASFTIETGLLIWVVYVTAYLAGSRSISRRALVVATAFVLVYLGLVLNQMGGSGNSLTNAPTGYGFGRLEPQEVTARFGTNPLPFYAYNIASSVATILFAEPRRGTWHFVAAWLQNDLRPSQWLVVGTTTLTTVVVAAFAVARLPRWWRAPVPPRERLVILFAAVLVANAAISFAYTKDDIMSPAGLLYALALFSVVSTLLSRAAGALRAGALAVLLTVLGCGWTIRVLDVPYALLISALRNQTDWARIDQWKEQNRFDQTASAYEPLIAALRTEALRMHVPNPYLYRRLRLWDRDYSGAMQ